MNDAHDTSPEPQLPAELALPCDSLDLLGGMTAGEQAGVLRTIVDALPEAVIVHRLSGEILFFSQGACDMLMYSSDEMAHLQPFGWTAPSVAGQREERSAHLLESGHADFESEALRSDGTTIPTDVSVRTLDAENGPIVVAVLRDISERKRSEARLVYLAFHDALTGLSNRAALDERLRVAMADSKRHRDVLGIGYIDLDRFKPVNDAYGHEVGDQVLVAIGQRLIGCVREEDLVSRIGGDEFVVVLPRLNSPTELEAVAQRLLSEVRAPILVDHNVCNVTASIGFALYDHETDDARSFVMKADVAMYAAKADQDNPWLLWDESMGMFTPD